MGAATPVNEHAADEFVQLTPLIRRVVGSRVRDPHIVDEVVQETLARVMSAQTRLDNASLAPYAVTVARNLLSARWRDGERAKRNAHKLVEPSVDERPEDSLLNEEERRAVAAAVARLSDDEREKLLAHELEGRGTADLAAEAGSTSGAVAAQLHRTRAKMRVEYLLALDGRQLPTPTCRAILLALSAGDRRRQRELDVATHLVECEVCAGISGPLLDRRDPAQDPDEKVVPIQSERDVVTARQQGREMASRLPFTSSELTLIATAISEIARNIVRFASRGHMSLRLISDAGRQGVLIVARDKGPGIADIGKALTDGHSTYGGMGLGLPGSRRLMDELVITSEVDKGTTVTMVKWCGRS